REEVFVDDAGPAKYLVLASKIAPESGLPPALFEKQQQRHRRHGRIGVPVGRRPVRFVVESRVSLVRFAVATDVLSTARRHENNAAATSKSFKASRTGAPLFVGRHFEVLADQLRSDGVESDAGAVAGGRGPEGFGAEIGPPRGIDGCAVE